MLSPPGAILHFVFLPLLLGSRVTPALDLASANYFRYCCIPYHVGLSLGISYLQVAGQSILGSYLGFPKVEAQRALGHVCPIPVNDLEEEEEMGWGRHSGNMHKEGRRDTCGEVGCEMRERNRGTSGRGHE